MHNTERAAHNVTVFKINYYVKFRRIASYVALGLLVVTYAAPHNELLLWLRSIAWGVEGGCCVLEAFYRRKAKLPIGTTLLYSALYFGFAVLLMYRASHVHG